MILLELKNSVREFNGVVEEGILDRQIAEYIRGKATETESGGKRSPEVKGVCM
jgi:hypothetical protein